MRTIISEPWFTLSYTSLEHQSASIHLEYFDPMQNITNPGNSDRILLGKRLQWCEAFGALTKKVTQYTLIHPKIFHPILDGSEVVP